MSTRTKGASSATRTPKSHKPVALLTHYAADTSFHELVAKRRKALDLTQAVLARRCKVVETMITKIENGSRLPDMKYLPRMAEVLLIDLGRFSMTYLMTRSYPIYEAILNSPWKVKHSALEEKVAELPPPLRRTISGMIDTLLEDEKQKRAKREA
jgi:transcriptional regulator with XRE-family HTH domain